VGNRVGGRQTRHRSSEEKILASVISHAADRAVPVLISHKPPVVVVVVIINADKWDGHMARLGRMDRSHSQLEQRVQIAEYNDCCVECWRSYVVKVFCHKCSSVENLFISAHISCKYGSHFQKLEPEYIIHSVYENNIHVNIFANAEAATNAVEPELRGANLGTLRHNMQRYKSSE
jgi:hypothetical protein